MKVYAITPDWPALATLDQAGKKRVRQLALGLLASKCRVKTHIPSVVAGVCGLGGALFGGLWFCKFMALGGDFAIWGTLGGVSVFGTAGGLLGKWLLDRWLTPYWATALVLHEAEPAKQNMQLNNG